MASVDFDADDYVDEISTEALARELSSRARLHRPAAEQRLRELRDAISGCDREDWYDDVSALRELLRAAFAHHDQVAFEDCLRDMEPEQLRHIRDRRQRDLYAAAMGREPAPAEGAVH